MPARNGPSAAALAKFESDFTKRFGDKTIRKSRKYKVVSTGSLTLDYALGCGGWIVGRVFQIWGPESVAKTTLMILSAVQFQKEFPNKLIGWIDMERTFDFDWATSLGLDMSRVKVFVPENSEDVADMAKYMIRTEMFSFVVLDSVGGMVTAEEMDKDAEQASVGTAAKILTRMVKTCAVLCDDLGVTLGIVNQVRANLGYGGDTTYGGGFALKHVNTHVVKLKRTGTMPYTIGSGTKQETYGFELAATVEKNKVAPPRRTATFALLVQPSAKYGPLGIDRATEACTMGVRLGIIEQQPGGYYALPGVEERIRSEDKVKAHLRENETTLNLVRTMMLDKLSSEVADEIPEDDPVDEGTEEIPDFAMGAPEHMKEMAGL